MGTPFIAFLAPSRLEGYLRGQPHEAQPASIPRTFSDAMEVRQAVFVDEQGVPPENEFDADDPRACHWVAYASVNTVQEQEVRDAAGNVVKPRRSVTQTVPIGTIRVVPFPHDPHPTAGGDYWDGKLVGVRSEEGVSIASGVPSSANRQPEVVPATTSTLQENTDSDKGSALDANPPPEVTTPQYGVDRQTDFHDGKEPYVKVGRLAVTKEFRGHRIANLLVATALQWLREHPGYFDPSVKAMGLEQLGAETTVEIPAWGGLVCAHAQQQVQRFWGRFGFEVDQGMGVWWEEGIPHVGMFQRLVTEPKVNPIKALP